MRPIVLSLLIAAALAVPPAVLPDVARAAQIGRMAPPEPLTSARIGALPAAGQPAWLAYLARSQAALAADQLALARERAGQSGPEQAPHGLGGAAAMPLEQPSAWYASAEARHIADHIVSFQTPAGGWGKNMPRGGPLRQRGQHYVVAEGPKDAWTFVGTIDNDATTTELRFLARVQAQLAGADGARYRAAFIQGVRYLLAAQYPNGGYPQVYPLNGGYHDAITYNDNAFSEVVAVLGAVAQRQDDYAFVPPALAADARQARDQALRLIVANQVVVNGQRTGWCQQYDALSLAPAGARNFEPAALAADETSAMLVTLMQLPDPTPDVQAAIHAGVAWLRDVAINDAEWVRAAPQTGNQLVLRKGAGPLWARYYDIATMRPIFGDRDRSIHDDVHDLSAERRDGYAWYGTWPAKALRRYAAWAGAHPEK